MKKLVVTALILCAGVFLQPADAAMIILDYQGDTIVTSNNIERTLLINSDDGGNYFIAIRPLEEYVSNSDGSIQIPLQYFYINNNKQDVYFRYNEYSNVFYDANMGGIPRSMNAKIKGYGIVPAGTYSINVEVQATDIETRQIASTTVFNLQFNILPYQELNLYSEEPVITVGAKDVFEKNRKVATESATMVYINSNTDWILSLDSKDFGEMAGNYYVRTIAGTSRVTNRLQERALITPGREIVLARGKAPAVNETVSVEYSVEGKDGKYIPAGNYVNTVKYILREGEK